MYPFQYAKTHRVLTFPSYDWLGSEWGENADDGKGKRRSRSFFLFKRHKLVSIAEQIREIARTAYSAHVLFMSFQIAIVARRKGLRRAWGRLKKLVSFGKTFMVGKRKKCGSSFSMLE